MARERKEQPFVKESGRWTARIAVLLLAATLAAAQGDDDQTQRERDLDGGAPSSDAVTFVVGEAVLEP